MSKKTLPDKIPNTLLCEPCLGLAGEGDICASCWEKIMAPLLAERTKKNNGSKDG